MHSTRQPPNHVTEMRVNKDYDDADHKSKKEKIDKQT